MAPRPTLAKVALAAGVSKTTASYVLNGTKQMNAETTRRVREAARNLGYRLDAAASSMSRGRSSSIGVLAGESVTAQMLGSSGLFWLRFDDAFVRRCSEQDLVVSFAGEGRAQSLVDSGIDALVVLGSHRESVFEDLRIPFGLPIVSLDPIPQYESVQLNHDHAAIADAVCSHFVEQGCTNLAWVTMPGAERLWDPVEVELAKWCKKHKLKFSHHLHDGSAEGIQDTVDAALEAGADGLFWALGNPHDVLDALTNRGKSVPDDVLFVMFAEGLVERSMTPSVSTMSFQGFGCGEAVADMCADVVNQGTRPELIKLPFELTVRESSLRNV